MHNYYAQSSSHHQPLRRPPLIKSSSTGTQVGVPVHICAESNAWCVKCAMPQNKRRNGYNQVVTSDRHRRLVHNQINVCTALEARPAYGEIPRELQGHLRAFNFTVQLSNMADDPTSWLFNDERLLAIIGPMVNHTVTVRKPYLTQGNNVLTMSRVNLEGPGFIMDYLLRSGDQFDIGQWGWYRYYDGSIRVWTWPTYSQSKPPMLLAWKNAADWHWFFHENWAGDDAYHALKDLEPMISAPLPSGQCRYLSSHQPNP
ncbi:hypothetical protein MVEN_00158400 [Mycena venus]|uniref:Uncharacterized protein n=1 Tax=Mycena venus TaxID=2733690 RepID=A0A8H7DCZ1_9AGAR|nr:hypothetical protein MVEN_00158400 [Mycena venus]